MSKKVVVRHTPKVECPKCGSKWSYWRLKTMTWVCRSCGTIFAGNAKKMVSGKKVKNTG